MAVTLSDIRAAHALIRSRIHETPVFTSELINRQVGASLFFKCENLQKAGAFKARGAANAVFQLPENKASAGVATHSSGNHGAALARAAKLRGIPAYIVVPSNAKAVKKAAILEYGGEVIECEPTLAAREQTLASVVERTGANFVPPYDDDRVIAGQGTAMLELAAQVPSLDMVVVPVGGGGLLAGAALVCEDAGISVYGAEPVGADDAYRSFATGNRVTSHVPDTIADGLLTTLGERNFEIIRRLVTGILLAEDDDIVQAMRLIWSRMKLVVEPSAAITLAVIQQHPEIFSGKRVGAILTGGNVDLDHLPFG